jgi:hypothetical protein
MNTLDVAGAMQQDDELDVTEEMLRREKDAQSRYGQSYYDGQHGLGGPVLDPVAEMERYRQYAATAVPEPPASRETGLMDAAMRAAQGPMMQPVQLGSGRFDPSGYLPGSKAAENPLKPSPMDVLNRRADDLRFAMERSDNATDRGLKQKALDYAEQQMGLLDPVTGRPMMDERSAASLLEAAASTNRLQYATTGTDSGRDIAAALGLPSRTPQGTSYGRETGGERYRVGDALQRGPQALNEWLEGIKTRGGVENVEQGMADRGQGMRFDANDEQFKADVTRPEAAAQADYNRNVARPMGRFQAEEAMSEPQADPLYDSAGKMIGNMVRGKFVPAADESLVDQRVLRTEQMRRDLELDEKLAKEIQSGSIKATPITADDGSVIAYQVGTRVITPRDESIFDWVSQGMPGAAPQKSQAQAANQQTLKPQEMAPADVISKMQEANPDMTRREIETKARELGYIK